MYLHFYVIPCYFPNYLDLASGRLFLLHHNQSLQGHEEKQEESDGKVLHLRGSARVETEDSLLTADEIDYNQETHEAEARGKVRYESFSHGEKLNCDRAEYNTESKTGKFYNVNGTSPSRIEARRGLLTTQNPFYFSGEWAEKTEDRYLPDAPKLRG